jgi:hypothetical protein
MQVGRVPEASRNQREKGKRKEKGKKKRKRKTGSGRKEAESTVYASRATTNRRGEAGTGQGRAGKERSEKRDFPGRNAKTSYLPVIHVGNLN